jgi:hypothetical protein
VGAVTNVWVTKSRRREGYQSRLSGFRGGAPRTLLLDLPEQCETVLAPFSIARLLRESTASRPAAILAMSARQVVNQTLRVLDVNSGHLGLVLDNSATVTNEPFLRLRNVAHSHL